MRRLERLAAVTTALIVIATLGAVPAVADPAPASPHAECGPDSVPETDLQGRVPQADITSGRYLDGYRCNTELVGSDLAAIPLGSFGGFKVERYVDAAGNECAYYDLQLLVGTGILDISNGLNAGVAVLDMSDPANPVRTATLSSLAMLTPHESLLVVPNRGLLIAVAGNPALAPGIVDIYDISEDCRQPQLLTLPNVSGLIGHESGISPDGMTFYSGAPVPGSFVSAVDITDPSNPSTLATIPFPSHGMSLSADGNHMYLTQIGPVGIKILDVSQIQARTPNPEVTEIGFVGWEGSIPQIARPVTIDGHPYLVEVDEFGALGGPSALGNPFPGAGRIIDIGDPTNPTVISDFRLEVHQPENFADIQDDSGSAQPVGGYSAHYCNVPRRDDPGIVACGMGSSGLRIFDIRDPFNPVEVAYYNEPAFTPDTSLLGPIGQFGLPPSWAMASPTIVPERCEVWYSDGRSGFRNVRLTNGVCDLMSTDSEPEPTPATPTSGTPATTPVDRGLNRGPALLPTAIAAGTAGHWSWLGPLAIGLALLTGAGWRYRRG